MESDADNWLICFQMRVNRWMLQCFSRVVVQDKLERCHRFYEESTELVQSAGMPREDAHRLVDYTYDRPVGELEQEAGGVLVTLGAWANTFGINLAVCGNVELDRAWENIDKIRSKQATKPKFSPLPQPAAAPIDYRELLLKYIAHVGNEEGVTFINRIRDDQGFTDDAEALGRYYVRFSEAEAEEMRELDQESIKYAPF